MKNTGVKIILVVAILLISTLALSSEVEKTFKKQQNYMTVQINGDMLDQILFYLLPADAQYYNIDIVNHNYIKVKEDQPQTDTR